MQQSTQEIIKKLRRVTQQLEFWPKTALLYIRWYEKKSEVSKFKKNNISDWNLEA